MSARINASPYAWLEASVRRSECYPLDREGPVPTRVLDAARTFFCECPDGDLGSRVRYRRSDKLLQQLPEHGAAESREALEAYDPLSEICICGEVAAEGKDAIFTVAARLPSEVFAEKQRDQRKRWSMVREQVTRLKSWGNAEMKDREVGTELAEKTYREALRILTESQLEDDSLELPLRSNLAEALARLHRWSESASECDRALQIDPGNTKALFRRGRANLRLDRGEEARTDLARAARAEPNDRAIREELEAAKRWTPPAVIPVAQTLVAQNQRGSSLTKIMRNFLLRFFGSWPLRLRAAAATLLQKLAPGAWRELCFGIMALLLFNAYNRLRRRKNHQV